MRVLNWYLDNDFLSSEFKVFKPVTLYFLSTGRTAWRGAWSEQYRSGSALFLILMRQSDLQNQEDLKEQNLKLNKFLVLLSTLWRESWPVLNFTRHHLIKI